MGLAKADLFNLTIIDTSSGGSTERFANLSFKESSRRIDKVLEAESKLARWYGTWPPAPLPTPAAGDDDVFKAEKDLAVKQKALDDLKKVTPPDPAAIAAAEAAVAAARTVLANAKKVMEDSDGQNLTRDDFTGPANKVQKKAFTL
jgi:hypothetical protein